MIAKIHIVLNMKQCKLFCIFRDRANLSLVTLSWAVAYKTTSMGRYAEATLADTYQYMSTIYRRTLA